MKKLLFVMGGAIGFVLGSRSGHKPYNQMREKVMRVTHRPEVTDLAAATRARAHAAGEKTSAFVEDRVVKGIEANH